MKILRQVYDFLRNPTNKIPADFISIKTKLKNLIILYLNEFILILTIVIVIQLFFHEENHTLINISKQGSFLYVFIMGILIIPVIEEIIFRLWLRFNPFYFAVSIFSLILVISSAYYQVPFYSFDDTLLLRLLIALIPSLFVYLILVNKFKDLQYFWNTHFNKILYFSIVLFGLLHITNYELSSRNMLLSPILTLPQLVSGVFLSYVRIKYGFFYGCLYHAIHNIIPVLINLS